MANNFDKYIIDPFLKSIALYSKNNAFCIGGIFYTYKQLGECVFKIRQELVKQEEEINYFGLVVNDDVETYASIFALWLEGKAYVPLHPNQPIKRNKEIISQVGITSILDSSKEKLFRVSIVIETQYLSVKKKSLILKKNISDNDFSYILFTSGSTGKPKGVPITRGNLSGFTSAFWELGIDLNENDRCLQMFELTFDLSVMSYLIPLLKGACVYTIPRNKIKYSYLYELMEDHKLTFSLMVPSMLNYLRPYFDEMNFPDMRYSLFCGEALPLEITEEWSQILPNANILNVYGPTEDTIFCTSYLFNRDKKNISYNGVLSIGKEMEGTSIIIVDDNNNILPVNKKGELCLSGVQLTIGYWNNKKMNDEMFFNTNHQGQRKRFYKTGDICLMDENKDILYLGRLDSQTQVQGFRVELSEIEYFSKKYLIKKNVVVVAFKNRLENIEIGLVIESIVFPEKDLIDYLKLKLPTYMIPSQVKFINEFPLNISGKIDKSILKKLFK